MMLPRSSKRTYSAVDGASLANKRTGRPDPLTGWWPLFRPRECGFGTMHPLVYALYNDGTSRMSTLNRDVIMCAIAPYLYCRGELGMATLPGVIDTSGPPIENGQQPDKREKCDVGAQHFCACLYFSQANRLVAACDTSLRGSDKPGAVVPVSDIEELDGPLDRVSIYGGHVAERVYPFDAGSSFAFYSPEHDRHYVIKTQKRGLFSLSAAEWIDSRHNGDFKDAECIADFRNLHGELPFGNYCPPKAACVDGRGSLALAYCSREKIQGRNVECIVIVLLYIGAGNVWRVRTLYKGRGAHACHMRMAVSPAGDLHVYIHDSCNQGGTGPDRLLTFKTGARFEPRDCISDDLYKKFN